MDKPTCEIVGCEKPQRTRGWCSGHYRRVLLTGDARADKPLGVRSTPSKRPPCIAPDCDGISRANKMCTLHNQRWNARQSFDLPDWTPKTDFRHGSAQGYNFHKCRCDDCVGWRATYQEANREHMASQTRRSRLARYGLTIAEYDAMRDTQGGVCAVCGEAPSGYKRNLCVDHDHETGAVRGLLCHLCNTALGHARDDPAMLDAMAAYLRTSR